jgi:hypothetical protein
MERNHLEDRGVDERMGSKWTKGRLAGGGGGGVLTWVWKGNVGGI